MHDLIKESASEFENIGCTCQCCDEFPECKPKDKVLDWHTKQMEKAYNMGRESVYEEQCQAIKNF